MLSRAAARQSSSNALLRAPTSLRASSFRQLPQFASRTARRYASGPAEAAKKTSDLPWMGVATIITIPSVYYLLQPRSPPDEGGHGHAEHASESHAEKPAEEGKDENADEGSDQGGESPAKKNPKGPDSKGTKVGAGVSSTNADEQGKKEEGISNTDTAHSSDISQDPGKSKKGEGTAETAKIKGTVKPDRPTPEQTNKSDDK